LLALATAATVLPACAESGDDENNEVITQSLARCQLDRVFEDVPVMAPVAGTCLEQPFPNTARCAPPLEPRLVQVICSNTCTSAALVCTWVDIFGHEHLIKRPFGGRKVGDWWTPCNNVNSCSGPLPLPGTL
jgi:hypothetical protein